MTLQKLHDVYINYDHTDEQLELYNNLDDGIYVISYMV